MKASTYILFHVFYSAFVGVVSWFILKAEFSGFHLMMVASGLLLGSVLSLVSYILIFNSLKGKPTAFVQGVMISMMVKMFSGMISILVVALKFKEISVAFAVTFMIGYFVFTIPEIISLNYLARKT